MTDPARTDAEKRAGERVSPHILRAKAMAGQRFGRLVAIMDRIERGAGNRLIGSFRCDCGSEVMAQLDSIRGGFTRSCGCLQRDISSRKARHRFHAKGKLGCLEADFDDL